MTEDRQAQSDIGPQKSSRLVDVAVAGAGVVGLAVAVAVKRGTALPCAVLLCDPALAADTMEAGGRSLRAVAVAADARRFLDRLGVWSRLEARAQPIAAMDLTDTRAGAVPAPIYLSFAGPGEPGGPFAHMVPQEALRNALLEAARGCGVVLEPRGVRDVAARPHAWDLDLGDGGRVAARLLVAADGGRSRLRERAGIGTVGWDYDQGAIVATLAHARPHGGRATQHFLPGGPLALLPLLADDGSDRRISIVWTERRAEADRLAALPDAAFVEALDRRIGHQLGAMRLEDRPRVTPLRVALARRLVGPRLALAGDAARVIHPLAGQGLNLGLRDAEALGAGVAAALDLGLDPASPHVLDGYQRARRPGALAMAAVTDGLNRLFSNDSVPLRTLRDVGLGLVDRAPGLKRLLMDQAAGRPAPRPPRARVSAGRHAPLDRRAGRLEGGADVERGRVEGDRVVGDPQGGDPA